VILQPSYLPWSGFFDQLDRSDVFIYYDDVQFDKHSWRNRNRIKSPQGAHWLTVPVLHTGLGRPRIMDIAIDNRQPWARKHIGTIRQFYREAAHVERYLPELEDLLRSAWESLVELNLAVVALMSRWLGLERRILRSSELAVSGERSERLVKLCTRMHATRYLSGDAARTYLDTALFARNGIDVAWHEYQHPVHEQLYGKFLPYLSALDLILNCGDESLDILKSTRKQATT
jgi:hypothetical protein